MKARWITDKLHKHDQMNISVTHPSVAYTIAVTGTGDEDLSPVTHVNSYVNAQQPGTDKYRVTYPYTDAEFSPNAAFQYLPNGRVKVLKAGKVEVGGYFDMSHSDNTATVGVTFAIVRNGVTTLSPRSVHGLLPNVNNIGSIAGAGTLNLIPNDEVYLVIASDKTGTVSVTSSTIQYQIEY